MRLDSSIKLRLKGTNRIHRRTTRSWVPYFIIIVYVAGCLASYGIWYFAVFLKALKNPDGSRLWSTSQVNAIPIGGSAVTAASG